MESHKGISSWRLKREAGKTITASHKNLAAALFEYWVSKANIISANQAPKYMPDGSHGRAGFK